VYYTTHKKGTLAFFYNGLKDFAAKLKIIANIKSRFNQIFKHPSFAANALSNRYFALM